jgi:hypothetical protein
VGLSDYYNLPLSCKQADTQDLVSRASFKQVKNIISQRVRQSTINGLLKAKSNGRGLRDWVLASLFDL